MKTAFITGAAGGLGKQVTTRLLALGYRVMAADMDVSGIDDWKQSGNLETYQIDLTDSLSTGQLICDLGLNETGLDLLICLAGIYDTFPVTESHPRYLDRMISVNFLSCASMISLTLPALVKKQGRVIVISSESYKIQAMFQPYMISKAALESYCRAAWQELTLKGVALSVIRPGAFRTPLLDWMNREGVIDPKSLYYHEFQASLLQSKKMVGTITSPEKVAEIVVKAATARKPRRYYHVNNNPLLSLISLVPANLIDMLIVKKFRKRRD